MSATGTLTESTIVRPDHREPIRIDGVIDPSPYVKQLSDGTAQLELSVHGVHCSGCIAKIEGALRKFSGVQEVRLNLTTGKLNVRWQNGSLAPSEITNTIAALGYKSAVFDPDAARVEEDNEGRFLLRCLAVAGFAAANVMLLSISVWAGSGEEMGQATRTLMHWISAAIAMPAAAYAGRPFFRSAFAALKAGHANMDVPISLAVVLALGLSVVETLNHGREAYFDAAVMLLFFLLIGRYLDHRLRMKARAAAHELLTLQATTANRLQTDGSIEAIPARDIKNGDNILLFPGDRAPVNGVVRSGESEVDVSLVTGESSPVKMSTQDTLYAGVLNISNKLTMQATATVEDSLIADLTRLIEAGEQEKSRYVRLADRAASLYVPLVHSLALATFLGWFFIADAGARISILNAVAVLIITCPCALGLAAPTVQIVATGRLFKAGILVKSGDALERLAEVDRFVFDKTGTLTFGRLKLSNQSEITETNLRKAAMLARASRHPLSRAVADASGAGPIADETYEIAGLGVEGKIDGLTARFGNQEWVGVAGDFSGVTEAWFRLDDGPPIRFQFEDALRCDARETITAIQKRNLECEMLSGDRSGPAARIADATQIETWRAELSPEEKIARLNALKTDGLKVAMVGDGINDTPALTAAHASLSPGSAADACQAAADFVFQGDKLSSVVTAYDVSKMARRRVIENFAFAAFYNFCAIPLAVFGFVTPLIAALAMSGSSVIVTLNALRLHSTKKNGGTA